MTNDEDENAVGANSIHESVRKSANRVDSQTVANRSADFWIPVEKRSDSHELVQECARERSAGL